MLHYLFPWIVVSGVEVAEMGGKFDSGHQLPKFLCISKQMGEESRQQAQAGIAAASLGLSCLRNPHRQFHSPSSTAVLGDAVADCFRYPRLVSLGVKPALCQFGVTRQYRKNLYIMSKYTSYIVWHALHMSEHMHMNSGGEDEASP